MSPTGRCRNFSDTQFIRKRSSLQEFQDSSAGLRVLTSSHSKGGLPNVGLRAASPALRLARVLFLRLDTSGQPLRRGHDMKVAPESTSLTAGSGVLSRTAHTGILLLSSSLHVLYINPEGRAQLYDFILQPPPSAYLPPAIRAFCQELFATLPTTPTPKDWF